MEDGHAKTVDEVLNYFGTDSEKGLSSDQVKRNQERYGPNGKWSDDSQTPSILFFNFINTFVCTYNFQFDKKELFVLVEN